jgi:hypothetical protein
VIQIDGLKDIFYLEKGSAKLGIVGMTGFLTGNEDENFHPTSKEDINKLVGEPVNVAGSIASIRGRKIYSDSGFEFLAIEYRLWTSTPGILTSGIQSRMKSVKKEVDADMGAGRWILR